MLMNIMQMSMTEMNINKSYHGATSLILFLSILFIFVFTFIEHNTNRGFIPLNFHTVYHNINQQLNPFELKDLSNKTETNIRSAKIDHSNNRSKLLQSTMSGKCLLNNYFSSHCIYQYNLGFQLYPSRDTRTG